MSVPADGSHAIRYRPHIDGLRGIAILGVIFYHADFSIFQGGFIGVDVFFVISGFLITSIILRDLRADSFSLAGFWERRIRRIFPALFVVMLATVIAGYLLILLPSDYHHFGSTVMAQSVFASNMLYMVSDSYFDQPSRFTPLLHTWTLSVEEQFYLFFPLLVALCTFFVRRLSFTSERKVERSLLASVAAISVISFFINIWFIIVRPGAPFEIHPITDGLNHMIYAGVGFYVLPTRAWELGLGALVALVSLKIKHRPLSEVLAFAGIMSILASVFIFSNATAFPGFAALLPTLGAAALIFAEESHSTISGRMLSWAPLLWVGLISYSLYLWHWPVFVFTKLATSTSLTFVDMLGLIIITFILAILSYTFIETPFRKKIYLQSRRAVYIVGLGAMAFLFLSGFLIYRNIIRNDDRINPAALEALAALNPSKEPLAYDYCFQKPGDESLYGGLCRLGDRDPSLKPQFVLWGDSQGLAMEKLFDELGKRSGVQGVMFAYTSCLPLPGVWHNPRDLVCEELKQNALAYIEDQDIKNVFIFGIWGHDVRGGPQQILVQRVTDSNAMPLTPEQGALIVERHLASLVEPFSNEGRNVYIMEQVPAQLNLDMRTMFYGAEHTGVFVMPQSVTTAENEIFQSYANAALLNVGKIKNVRIIDPTDVLCNSDSCPLERNGIFLYRDSAHVSNAGMELLRPHFAPIFQQMARLNERSEP